MAGPTIAPFDNIFTFNELANTTGSTFLHGGTRTASLTDDNVFTLPAYLASFTYSPLPQVLPGTLTVHADSTTNPLRTPPTQGTVSFNYSVIDKQVDFLRQGQTLVQNITVRVTDTAEGGFAERLVQVRITGANDRPTAHVDLLSVSEDVSVKRNVLANDTDPDFGDTKALTPASFLVYSVTSAAAPYLTKAMVGAVRVNFANNALPTKDSILVTLNKAFQGLTTGESASIVIKYGMVDGFGATSASEFRLTVIGSPDAAIVGTSANDPFLFGEKDADRILGLSGNDAIFGRGGNDVLTGGLGNDAFVFNTPLSATTNRDVITDFTNVANNNDVFRLENAIFTRFAAVGALNPAFFRAGAAALDANDYIVYNRATGGLFYDINGSAAGGAVQFATLTNKPVLTASDFVVI